MGITESSETTKSEAPTGNVKSSWSKPQKINALGHRLTRPLQESYDVLVTEKVDGSFFQFGLFELPDEPNVYKLRVMSKGQEIDVAAGQGAWPKMFTEGIETAIRLAPRLRLGWTYRGEYLKKPKHSTLAYDRVPIGHIIIFDILTGDQGYLPYNDVRDEAERIGLEVVPFFYAGPLANFDLKGALGTTAVLGGQKIEGLVIKPYGYDLFDPDGKVVFAKFVSTDFKEVHAKTWNKDNPRPSDIRDVLVQRLATEARWRKAIIHAQEEGILVNGVQDIGVLLPRISEDLFAEETERIKDALFGWAKQFIARGVTKGFPEWYKAKLAADALVSVDALIDAGEFEPRGEIEQSDNIPADEEVIHVGEVS